MSDVIKRVPIIHEAFDKALEEMMLQQMKVFWLPDEVKVEKDIQDVLTNFTEAEKHGIITVLKLFTIYEDFAGEEFWGGRFKNMYIENTAAVRMASAFSMFENCIHAPFYSKINQLLNIDTPEFYLSYLDNPVLRERVDQIGKIIDHPDDATSMAMFAFVEGCILYSSFAFIKHFQHGGKNKLNNLVRGIDWSLRDENMHYQASVFVFKHLTRNHTTEQMEEIKGRIIEGAKQIAGNEEEIIRMIFEKGSIDGITEKQLVNFVHSRINEIMLALGFERLYKVDYNPIAGWFYQAINGYKFNDMFAGQGAEYHRAWAADDFEWVNESNG